MSIQHTAAVDSVRRPPFRERFAAGDARLMLEGRYSIERNQLSGHKKGFISGLPSLIGLTDMVLDWVIVITLDPKNKQRLWGSPVRQ